MTLEPAENIELTIIDGQQDRRITAVANQSLLDILKQQGIYVNAPCGGRGTCGKCKIELVAGRLMVASAGESEARLVEPGEMALACRATVAESCCIDISALTEQSNTTNANKVLLRKWTTTTLMQQKMAIEEAHSSFGKFQQGLLAEQPQSARLLVEMQDGKPVKCFELPLI